MKKSVLVTGAAGHIGANLCHWLVKNKPQYEVLALDDLSGGYQEFLPPNVKFYLRDVGSDLTDIFEENDIDLVYHLSAIAAESAAIFRRKHYYTNNVVNSANLINHCIEYEVERLVFFSSMAVYGRNEVPFVESQIPAPCDSYGIGKYAVELDLESARQTHGLKYSIVRPHSVYGKYQSLWDSARNVLGIWARQTLNNEQMTIYGDGSQTRAFTFIDDILELLWECGTNEKTLHQTYNLGNDQEMTILEAAKICKEIYGNNLPLKFLPAIHEVRHAWSDHSKVKQELGFECKTSLKDGVRQMWKWAKNEPKREVKKIDNFEIKTGLYEHWK